MSVRATFFNQFGRLSRLQKRAIFLGFDTALAPAAFCTAMVGRLDFGWPSDVIFLTALSGIAMLAAVSFGLPRFKLNAYGRHAIVPTGKYAAVIVLGTIVLCQMNQIKIEPLEGLQFGLLLLFGSVTGRFAMLAVLVWALHRGQSRCRVLIYGAGETGQQLALALRNHHRIIPVGFLDDNTDLQAVTVAGLAVLSPARLETAVRDLGVSRVLLAMPSVSAAKSAQITRNLKSLGLEVQALPSFEQLAGTAENTSLDILGQQQQFLGRTIIETDVSSMEAAYTGRVVLVTGAGGSVGSELCRQLIAHRPKALVLYERSEIALYTIERELHDLVPDATIVPVLGSVSDARLAVNVMVENRVDVVFHAAAYKHVALVEANPVAGLANNVLGTRVIAQAAVKAGVPQFVLISTDKAVRPKSVMGATKRLAEFVVNDLAKRSPGTRFLIVRFGNVLGSSGSVIPLFAEQIARGGPVTLTHDDVTRYFMTIAEAAQLVLLAGIFPSAQGQSDVFVLDMGRSIKIRDLAEQLINAEGLTVKSAANPKGDIEISIIGLRQGEKLHEDLTENGQLFLTSHPKIMRLKEPSLPERAFACALSAVDVAVRSGDQLAARHVMARWVEGFPQAASGKSADENMAGNHKIHSVQSVVSAIRRTGRKPTANLRQDNHFAVADGSGHNAFSKIGMP